MLKNYYLDTSIWLDFYESRGRNGEFALKLFEKIICENLVVFYSELIVKELKRLGYSITEIKELFSISVNLRKVHIFSEQLVEARKLARKRNIPKNDVLHAILARDNCLQLISTDKHFLKLKDLTNVKTPEQFT